MIDSRFKEPKAQSPKAQSDDPIYKIYKNDNKKNDIYKQFKGIFKEDIFETLLWNSRTK